MNRVITIGREFGSGGREIGVRLAERLGIPFYDKEIVTMAAEAGGLDEAFIEMNEEGGHRVNRKGGIKRASMASFAYKPSFSDGIFLHQSNAVKQLAAQGPCVIVGRCSDYVLRFDGSIDIFIAASMPFKIARKRAMAPEKADYTDAQMEKWINDVNRTRQDYYEHYTGRKWGHIQNYHLCVFSDMVGIDGSVETILAYINAVGDK